jgi:hypothetical protein
MIQRFAQFSCCLWLDASVAHQSARSASSLSTSGHRVQLVRERGHHDRWHRVGPSHSQGTILVWPRASAPWLVEEGRMGDGVRIGAASKRNDLVAIEISRVAPEPPCPSFTSIAGHHRQRAPPAMGISRHKQVYRSSGRVRESTSSLINPSLRLCARTSSHFCVVGANLD